MVGVATRSVEESVLMSESEGPRSFRVKEVPVHGGETSGDYQKVKDRSTRPNSAYRKAERGVRFGGREENEDARRDSL